MNKFFYRILIVLMIAVTVIWAITFAIPVFILFGFDASTWPMKIIVDLEDKI